MTHAEKAVELFANGCNCSQAVFTAFSDVTGMDEELAKRLSSSFGGGIGRMRKYAALVRECSWRQAYSTVLTPTEMTS